MRLKGFIELHDYSTNNRIMININNISVITDRPSQPVMISVNETAPFAVKESYETIHNEVLASLSLFS